MGYKDSMESRFIDLLDFSTLKYKDLDAISWVLVRKYIRATTKLSYESYGHDPAYHFN